MTFSANRSSARTAIRFGSVALAALLLGACISDQGVVNRGFVLDDKALDQIRPGSSAEQVILVLGTPSTTSTVGSQTYYYISQRMSQPALFMEPKITDQRVIAIYLDKSNKVERVANYGIKDGKIFDFISRETPTGGAENSFLASLFRRIGKSAV